MITKNNDGVFDTLDDAVMERLSDDALCAVDTDGEPYTITVWLPWWLRWARRFARVAVHGGMGQGEVNDWGVAE